MGQRDSGTLEYAALGGMAVVRVKKLLGRLDSVERSERRESEIKEVGKQLSHKFMGQIEAIFCSLPRPKEWRSFYEDLIEDLKGRAKERQDQTQKLERNEKGRLCPVPEKIQEPEEDDSGETREKERRRPLMR